MGKCALVQALPEIPVANYAGFEIAIDRFDLPAHCRAVLVFETALGAQRLNPVEVTTSHYSPLGETYAIACDCCGDTRLTRVGKKDRLEIQSCENCGLVFTSPRPDLALIQQRYSEDYF
jgi:hypothetical protein